MKKNMPRRANPKPRKARQAAAATPPSPPLPPEPRSDDTNFVESMLPTQLEATRLAAMGCLHRARTPDSPEVRDRELSLFTQQANGLERGQRPAAVARATSGVCGARPAGDQRLAAAARTLAEAAQQISAYDRQAARPRCTAVLPRRGMMVLGHCPKRPVRRV